MESTENSPENGMAKKTADRFAGPEKGQMPRCPLPGKTRRKDRNIRENRFFPERRKTRLIKFVPCSSGSQAGKRRIDSPVRPTQAPGNRTTEQKKESGEEDGYLPARPKRKRGSGEAAYGVFDRFRFPGKPSIKSPPFHFNTDSSFFSRALPDRSEKNPPENRLPCHRTKRRSRPIRSPVLHVPAGEEIAGNS